MTLKGYAIFKGKLTGGLKNDIRNLVNFHVSSCKPEGTLKGLEVTLKVYAKSLTTVLNEVHFILNLYSFPLPLVPQANPSFAEVSHLPPSQAEQLPKLPSLFLLTPLF